MRYSCVLVAATASAAAATNNATCNSVQIFLVRGHGESVPGLQTSITDAICNDVTSNSSNSKQTCGFQSIAYDANSGAETICQDQYDGIQMLRGNLTAYATACPSSRLVVSGWSQGGALVTDLLAGGGDGLDLTGTCVQPSSPALAPDEFPGPRVAAVVTFGELHHNADMPWNVGNGSAADGRYPRTEAMLKNLSLWTDRFRDYCVVDDPLCAQGTEVAAHSSYFQSAYWPGLVAEFVRSRL
ncbi:carbohydrate esterase family 5 protein [Apiospora marii]|uniref:carbohydrate esterase family 5 protein n=1 Tax=Apiospora marii TaxID=335849 RepID=UPI003131D7C3